MQGSQKIGAYPGQLNFALVRAVDPDEVETPRGDVDELRSSEGAAPPPPPPPSAVEGDLNQLMQPPPQIVVQHLKSAAEELLQNVGTQNVCKQCGERIDFVQVSPDKIGELKKQMDHTGLWKDRWFQLYGNHLVYWNDAKEDLDLASGRGVIHLDANVLIASEGAGAMCPAAGVGGGRGGGGVSSRSVGGGGGGVAARGSQERGTIMAGSMTGSAMAGDETHAGRKLLADISDSLDDDGLSIDASGGGGGAVSMLSHGSSTHLSSGSLLPPPESPRQNALSAAASESDLPGRDEFALARGVSQTFQEFKLPGTGAVEPQKDFSVVLPHKTYRFRAETAQDRDSWVAALNKSTQVSIHHDPVYCIAIPALD